MKFSKLRTNGEKGREEGMGAQGAERHKQRQRDTDKREKKGRKTEAEKQAKRRNRVNWSGGQQ